jgi:2-polyprenyl-6-methoxyphenol hydroxylase-like FAD-dependent oxidoreductase
VIESDICIVGNGAIAKTAALGLAQAGLSVTLLGPPLPPAPPASADPGWDARVYALNHTATGCCLRLKSGMRWMPRVAPVDAMIVHGDGPQAGGLVSMPTAPTPNAGLDLEDRNLNQALDAALRFAQNVRCDRPCHRPAARRRTAPPCIWTTAAASRRAGGRRRRRPVLGARPVRYRPRLPQLRQSAVVSNFACELPHHGAAYQWFTGAEGIVACCRCPAIRCRWCGRRRKRWPTRCVPVGADRRRLAVYAHEKLGALTPLQPELVRDFPLRLIRPHA